MNMNEYGDKTAEETHGGHKHFLSGGVEGDTSIMPFIIGKLEYADLPGRFAMVTAFSHYKGGRKIGIALWNRYLI